MAYHSLLSAYDTQPDTKDKYKCLLPNLISSGTKLTHWVTIKTRINRSGTSQTFLSFPFLNFTNNHCLSMNNYIITTTISIM